MRAALLVKLAQAAANLMLATSVLLSAWVLASHPGQWFGNALSIVTAVCMALTFFLQRRTSRWDVERGRWQEQNYVIGSLVEAVDRQITPSDWIDCYMERVLQDTEA